MPRLTLVMILVALTASPAPGQLPKTWRADLLATREGAWRDFFGNPAGLDATLTDDFIAIDDGGMPWTNKVATLEQSRVTTRSGTRIATLEFPDTVIQQYGNVAIIYTTYALSTTTSGETGPVRRGRATEMFRWNGRRWLHTGWHLSPLP